VNQGREGKEESILEQEVRYLDPEGVTIWRDGFGQLRLKLTDGREFRDVHLTLAFPLSNAGRMLIVRDADLGEIGVIDEYTALDDQSRAAVLAELEKAYFTPRITRILSARENNRLATFEMETDRGPRTIQVQFQHGLRLLSGGRVLVHDVDANRYEIPNLADLDVRSQALMDEFL